MSAKTIEPLPLGGYVCGMDFSHENGLIEVATDESFRSALGKKARVLLVPDEPEYRAAPDLADALAACEREMVSEARDIGADDYHEAINTARAALRKAGRIA